MSRDKYNGWVKLHRKAFISEWATDPKTNYLFLYLIAMVNSEPDTWQGIPIKRGEMVTSYAKLSSATGLSVQNIRTSIKRLLLTNQITQQTNRDYQVISIVCYDKYQQSNKEANKPTNTPNNKPTNNKQEEKKRRREEDIIPRINSSNNIIRMNDFDSFWNLYPKKINKTYTSEIFDQVLNNKKATIDEILIGAEVYAEASKELNDQFLMSPDNWLRKSCWENKLEDYQGKSEQEKIYEQFLNGE